MKISIHRFTSAIENSAVIQSLRTGLVTAIPVLLIGSIALILNSLEIAAYQDFIGSFAGGTLKRLFTIINNATFGLLSVYMTVFISLSYARLRMKGNVLVIGAPITATACFAILSGILSPGFSIESFGVKGMFTAVITAEFASALYLHIASKAKDKNRFYSDGADYEFRQALDMLLPAAFTIAIFALADILITSLTGASTFQALFIHLMDLLFSGMQNDLGAGLLYVVLSSTLWFFGIHGSDVLEGVTASLFTPAEVINAAQYAAGLPGTEVLTKSFFDVFVLVGGCGTALSLLVAILLFSRRRNIRSLGRIAAGPMLFNINELMVFGLPVVYNVYLAVPFLLTPIAAMLITYFSMHAGLVPVPVRSISWTTPVLLGGYLTTQSIRGAILQFVNVSVGVAIYAPFVRLLDRAREREMKSDLALLSRTLLENEENNLPVTLTNLPGPMGNLARLLSVDILYAMDHGEFKLFYQPQYNEKGACIGAEALLRWKHGSYGNIIPPVIIKLAEESGCLVRLEKQILTEALIEKRVIEKETGHPIKISVNVTVETLRSPGYPDFVSELVKRENIDPNTFCLEVTEQMALCFDHVVEEAFGRIRALGVRFAIDDFSMGHTSLSYLQSGEFSLVKLDGSIVKSMDANDAAKEIVASIVKLSKKLNMDVLAEYVETETHRDTLLSYGCRQYQGYLYSPAVPPDELIGRLKREEN